MDTSDWIASIAVIVAIGTTWWSIRVTKHASEEARKQAQRAGVSVLHEAWEGIHDIDPENPITPTAVAALQAMRLTAQHWLHEIVDRDVIHEYAWDDYKRLYENFRRCEKELPGMGKSGKAHLTDQMGDAYGQMKVWKVRN